MAVFFPENIPKAIKTLPNWTLWKREAIASVTKKVPYQVSGKKAKSNNPSTWCRFETAFTAYQDVEGFDGICWMMPVKPSDIIFIDIDHCIKGGVIEPWAKEIVERFNSYTERSQSCEGLHILIEGIKPIRRCRKAGKPFEIYDCLRPCYLTGDVVIV
jgi:primase-polymerase (primpol)-like protein